MLRSKLSSRQRTCWAAVFALLIGMRLLTPHGFMPVVIAGQVAIALCDDAGTQVGASAHHGHAQKDKAKHRQSCPYAAASAQTFVEFPSAAVPLPVAFASEGNQGGFLAEVPFLRKIQRPPSRAPPVIA